MPLHASFHPGSVRTDGGGRLLDFPSPPAYNEVRSPRKLCISIDLHLDSFGWHGQFGVTRAEGYGSTAGVSVRWGRARAPDNDCGHREVDERP